MMTSLDQSLTTAELERLDAFLRSDAVSEHAMSLLMLNGFLTAVASGPNMLMPSVWLDVVWGEHEEDAPTFASDDEAKTILTLILRYMNEVNAALQNMTLVPLFCELRDEEQRQGAEAWAYGYMAGLACDPDGWKPIFKDKQAHMLMLPIMMLSAPPGFFDDGDPSEDDKYGAIPLIPKAAEGIFGYWYMKRSRSLPPMYMRAKSAQKSKPKSKRKKTKRQKR